MTKYLVHATVTCEIEVEVNVTSQDTGVQKHVAAQHAKQYIGQMLAATPLDVTGIATGAVWPTELHPLANDFIEGAIGPDSFFPTHDETTADGRAKRPEID